MGTPRDRKYTSSHEWVRMDGDLAVVGITDYAQETLGDVTYFEPPELGAALRKGGQCAEIESVKAASDIFAPVAGEVAEVNAALEDSPELVNDSPYAQGWLFKLRNVDPGELDALLDASAYDEAIQADEQ